MTRNLLISIVIAGMHAAASPSWAQNAFTGKGTYDGHCAVCHGPTGHAAMPGVPSFARGERLQMPDVVLLQSVKNGKNMCPSQRQVLRDAELFNVMAYIRTLRR